MKLKETIACVVLCTMTLTLGSCTDAEEVINNEVPAGYAPVSVHVDDFTISMGEFPRTRGPVDPANYKDIGAITLAFYQGSTEVFKETQLKKTAISFGTFSLSLPIGAYKMVVLGYDFYSGDELILTSPTSAAFTSDHVRETFTYTEDVAISSTAGVSLSATLNRVVAEVIIVSTDNKSADASTVRTTFSGGGKAFNPTTGLATADTGLSNTVGASLPVGSPTMSYNDVFLTSDEEEMDLTIEVLDAQGETVSQRTVSNVPLKRNRMTTLRGALYTSGATAAFQLETDWLPGTEIPF